MRVLITGIGGLIGQVLAAELVSHGHDVVGLAVEPLPNGLESISTCFGDAGDPEVVAKAVAGVDAVAHLAAIPNPLVTPDNVFTNNTRATFVTLDQAGRAGISRAVMASSTSVLGLVWAQRTLHPLYVPIDEKHPCFVEDSYALSKWVDEATAAMMTRKYGINVIAYRFPFTGHGNRLQRRVDEVRADPGAAANDLWAYIHTHDAARALRLGLESNVEGSHVMNVVAADTIADVDTVGLLMRYHPTVEMRSCLSDRLTPYTTDKAERLIGFRSTRHWSQEFGR